MAFVRLLRVHARRPRRTQRRHLSTRARPRLVERVRGTCDYLPTGTLQHQHIIAVISDVCRAHGFLQYETPVLEHSGLFDRTLGTSSDIVNKEMYRLGVDGQDDLALRPEGTAGLARALLKLGIQGNSPPVKAFYHGPMFRRERPQKGRYRQFTQIGVEHVGDETVTADIECIAAADMALRNLGLGDGAVELRVNTLGDEESTERFLAVLQPALLACRDDLSRESRDRLDRGALLRILDSKNPKDIRVLKRDTTPKLNQYLTPEARDRFNRVLLGLQELGVPYTLAPRLVRGLDYYSHTCFEFVDLHRQEGQTAVLAGGRYDDLFEMLGGRVVPAIGWAAGVERLGLLRTSMKLEPSTPPVIGIVSISDGSEKADTVRRAGLVLAHECRRLFCREGIRAHVLHDPRGNARHQFKRMAAHSSDPLDPTGAPRDLTPAVCLVLGDAELEGDFVTVKDMEDKSQRQVPRHKLLTILEPYLQFSGGPDLQPTSQTRRANRMPLGGSALQESSSAAADQSGQSKKTKKQPRKAENPAKSQEALWQQHMPFLEDEEVFKEAASHFKRLQKIAEVAVAELPAATIAGVDDIVVELTKRFEEKGTLTDEDLVNVPPQLAELVKEAIALNSGHGETEK